MVVDFGLRRNRRPWVLRDRLLLDGDRRGETCDQIDVRLVHPLEKLPCVGAQALDVPALAFRINRIEGERRLPRTRRPGKHDQPVPRQLDVDAFKVMLPRPANDNVFAGTLARIRGGIGNDGSRTIGHEGSAYRIGRTDAKRDPAPEDAPRRLKKALRGRLLYCKQEPSQLSASHVHADRIFPAVRPPM